MRIDLSTDTCFLVYGPISSEEGMPALIISNQYTARTVWTGIDEDHKILKLFWQKVNSGFYNFQIDLSIDMLEKGDILDVLTSAEKEYGEVFNRRQLEYLHGPWLSISNKGYFLYVLSRETCFRLTSKGALDVAKALKKRF